MMLWPSGKTHSSYWGLMLIRRIPANGTKIDPNDSEMLKAAGEIARKTAKAGKFPCTLAITAEAARRARDLGFQLIALGNDFNYLTLGAKALLSEARGAA
jgi:2-keto-3-deoxy-L-rhamnonate aldolase RhmA